MCNEQTLNADEPRASRGQGARMPERTAVSGIAGSRAGVRRFDTADRIALRQAHVRVSRRQRAAAARGAAQGPDRAATREFA